MSYVIVANTVPIKFIVENINGEDEVRGLVNEHIIDFRYESNPTFPDWFPKKNCLNVCIGAGDGYDYRNLTDIQKLPKYDIYICGMNPPTVLLNLQFILDHFPRQKLIICMDIYNDADKNKLLNMLRNRCQFIASDISAPQLAPDHFAKELLMQGGQMINYMQTPGRAWDEAKRTFVRQPNFMRPAVEGFECHLYSHNQWGFMQVCKKSPNY